MTTPPRRDRRYVLTSYDRDFARPTTSKGYPTRKSGLLNRWQQKRRPARRVPPSRKGSPTRWSSPGSSPLSEGDCAGYFTLDTSPLSVVDLTEYPPLCVSSQDEVDFARHSTLDTSLCSIVELTEHPSLGESLQDKADSAQHFTLDTSPFSVLDTTRCSTLDASLLSVVESTEYPSLGESPQNEVDSTEYSTLDPSPSNAVDSKECPSPGASSPCEVESAGHSTRSISPINAVDSTEHPSPDACPSSQGDPTEHPAPSSSPSPQVDSREYPTPSASPSRQVESKDHPALGSTPLISEDATEHPALGSSQLIPEDSTEHPTPSPSPSIRTEATAYSPLRELLLSQTDSTGYPTLEEICNRAVYLVNSHPFRPKLPVDYPSRIEFDELQAIIAPYWHIFNLVLQYEPKICVEHHVSPSPGPGKPIIICESTSPMTYGGWKHAWGAAVHPPWTSPDMRMGSSKFNHCDFSIRLFFQMLEPRLRHVSAKLVWLAVEAKPYWIMHWKGNPPNPQVRHSVFKIDTQSGDEYIADFTIEQFGYSSMCWLMLKSEYDKQCTTGMRVKQPRFEEVEEARRGRITYWYEKAQAVWLVCNQMHRSRRQFPEQRLMIRWLEVLVRQAALYVWQNHPAYQLSRQPAYQLPVVYLPADQQSQ